MVIVEPVSTGCSSGAFWRSAWSCFLILNLLRAADGFVPSTVPSRRRGREWCLSSLMMPCRRRSTSFVHATSTTAAATTTVEYDDFLPQPNPEWDALTVLHACMNMLLQHKDAGLEVCFNFSSDRCRAALGGSLEQFAQYATNPIFGFLVHCVDYQVVSVGPIIAGTATRGAMQTVLLDAHQQPQPAATTTAIEGGEKGQANAAETDPPRRFLWTFQRERRPPRQNCWTIHEVVYVENAVHLTL